MRKFGCGGKSVTDTSKGPSSRTRSKTKANSSAYSDCPQAPLLANPTTPPVSSGSKVIETADGMSLNVEEQLAQLRDLFDKRYSQMGETLESVQASWKEPSDSPVKAKLEPFSGYENQDVNRWLLKFSNRLALRHKTTDSKAAAADLSFHLAGPAETWYYALDQAVREAFNALKAALLKRFSNPDLEWRLRQKLSSRKQGETEPLDSYVDFLSATCQRLGISDQDKMHYFVQGLREEIKHEVIMHKPKTFEEAESVARLQVSVEQTLQDDRSSDPHSDPEKAVLYRMLKTLAAAKEEPNAKLAAFVPQNENDLATQIKQLRADLSREIRDELRAVKDSLHRNEQGPRGGHFQPRSNNRDYPRDPPNPRQNIQGGGDRSSPGGGNYSNNFQRGTRRVDGRPVCFRCTKRDTWHATAKYDYLRRTTIANQTVPTRSHASRSWTTTRATRPTTSSTRASHTTTTFPPDHHRGRTCTATHNRPSSLVHPGTTHRFQTTSQRLHNP